MEENREKRRRSAPRKIRHRKQMEALRVSTIQPDPEPLEPEEGLVCMGDRCFCHRLVHENSGAQNRCAYRKKGGKCDAMF